MHLRQIPRVCSERSLLLLLGLLLLTACGSNTADAGTSAPASGASATATACAGITRPTPATRTVVGTLKSISGQTLQLTNQRGTTLTVTYTSATRFTQEAVVAAASLQEGTPVRVVVTSTAGSYTATSIMVSANAAGGTPVFPRNGTPGAGRGNLACFARARGNGTPGAGAGAFRGLVGTVNHLNGKTLTITDNAGADFTVTLTTRTQIIGTRNASAAALKVGQAVTVTGRAGDQGSVVANLVAILLSLPTRLATPTPTP
ncbi:MAG TPA: DUF5666 domain-containing protein [Ktedonobacteraceae bacterium]|jgi:hypothetical protein